MGAPLPAQQPLRHHVERMAQPYQLGRVQRRAATLLPLLMAHRARCLKDEPGILQFEVLAPREDDARVLLYEVYRDDAAFDVHFNGPSIARATGMILNLYGTRCSLVE